MGNKVLINSEKASVLILSGDICVVDDLQEYNDVFEDFRSMRLHNFFINCSKEFKHVVYVIGNHESYHGDVATTANVLKERLRHIPNLYVLDNESIEINDITFVGGTLWTNMNGNDENTLKYIKNRMNDFRIIENSDIKLEGSDIKPAYTPEDSVNKFKDTISYIEKIVSDSDKKYVVVTHHAPSFKSMAPQYANQTYMNGGYMSDLDQFIIDHPNILMWTHGHVHTEWDYTIGSTRIVCNPRGYIGYEERAENFVLKYFDI